MLLTRDEFRKKLASTAGRAELGVILDAEQAAGILADDTLLDSWYRKTVTAPAASDTTPPPAPASAPVDPPTTPRLPGPAPAVAKPATTRKPAGPTFTDQAARTIGRGYRKTADWGKTTTKKQRLTTGIIAGALVVAIIGTVVTVNVVQNVQQAEFAAAVKAADAKRQADLKAAAAKKFEEDIRDAHLEAESLLSSEKKFVDNPPAWADLAAVALVQRQYGRLELQNRADNLNELTRTITDFKVAKSKVGTEVEAAARAKVAAEKDAATKFRAAVVAAGANPPATETDEALVKDNQDFCARVKTENATNPAKTIGEFRVLNPERRVAVQFFCPDMQPLLDSAAYALADGNHIVGGAPDGKQVIAGGVYNTIGPVSDCYWERHNGGGDIIDNDFITHAPDGARVTVYEGEGFSTQGCGLWLKVG